jgi:hypothetical protein
MEILLRRASWGIQARLTMLAIVTALPLVAIASFAILRTVDDQRTQIQSDVQQMVESFLADVDREISAIQAELQALATSPSLQTGDFRAFDQQMRAALSDCLHRRTGELRPSPEGCPVEDRGVVPAAVEPHLPRAARRIQCILGVRLRQLQSLCSTKGSVSSPPSDRFLRIAFGQSGGWSNH